MKKVGIWNRSKLLVAAAACMMLVLLCAGIASAYPALDSTQPVSLTVSASADGAAISSLRFTLYKAADMAVGADGAAEFTLTDAFAAYGDEIEMNLDPEGMDSSEWAAGAATVAPYVLRDSKNGSKSFESLSAATDADGKAAFSGVGQGLYLMTGIYEGSDFETVTVTPVFLTLPQLSEDGSSWIYSASASAKTTAKTPDTEAKTVSVSVRKVWSGDDTAGTSSRRPESITVDLLDSTGAVVDTQTLSATNAWSFTWTGLSEGTWSVAEKDVPSNYSVSQEETATEDGKTVTITNTTPPAGVQGESREKTSTSDKSKDKDKKVKGSSRSGDTANVASASRLPQTGQLWWPVWLLSGIAAVLVILGLILRLSGRRDMKD